MAGPANAAPSTSVGAPRPAPAAASCAAAPAASLAAPLLVEAQTAVQAAAAAAGDASERLREALSERDALHGELRALQRRVEAAPPARRDERLLAQLKVRGLGPSVGCWLMGTVCMPVCVCMRVCVWWYVRVCVRTCVRACRRAGGRAGECCQCVCLLLPGVQCLRARAHQPVLRALRLPPCPSQTSGGPLDASGRARRACGRDGRAAGPRGPAAAQVPPPGGTLRRAGGPPRAGTRRVGLLHAAGAAIGMGEGARQALADEWGPGAPGRQ
jgi:hypothetical protein